MPSVSPGPNQATPSKGKTVLLAEKQNDFARKLSTSLERAGFRTTVVQSGQEAMQTLSKKSYDVALLEIIIPNGLGTEICLEIKKDRRLSKMPVILMSSGVKEISGIQIAQEEYRADDYLLKPFDPEFLVEKIQTLFRKRDVNQPIAAVEARPGYNIDDVVTFPGEEKVPNTKQQPAASRQDFNFYRHNLRVPFNIRVDYTNADIFFSSPTMNISKGGIFIRTDHPLPVGRVLRLQFALPDHDEPVKGYGRVVWSEKAGGDRLPGMGVRFKDFAEEDLTLIYAYVRRLRELVR